MEGEKVESVPIFNSPEWTDAMLACLDGIRALLADETSLSKEKVDMAHTLAKTVVLLDNPMPFR